MAKTFTNKESNRLALLNKLMWSDIPNQEIETFITSMKKKRAKKAVERAIQQ